MCIYTETRYSCGHFHHGVAIGTGALVVNKCIPVKVALEYWHRQLQYLPIEGPTGTTMACPQACRPVHPFTREVVGTRAQWEDHDRTLQKNMHDLEIRAQQVQEVLNTEATVGLDSMRVLPNNVYPSQPYPRDAYDFIRDLQVFQALPEKAANVQTINSPKGCGCPVSPNLPSPCLVGWSFTEILMLRMREWNTPPLTHWLHVDYGRHIQHFPPRNPSLDEASTAYTIPISRRLKELQTLLDQNAVPHAIGSLQPARAHQAAVFTHQPAILPQAAGEAAVSEHPGTSGDQYPRPNRRPSSVPPGHLSGNQCTGRSTSPSDGAEQSHDAQEAEASVLSEQLAASHLGGPGPSSTSPAPASFAQSGADPEEVERIIYSPGKTSSNSD